MIASMMHVKKCPPYILFYPDGERFKDPDELFQERDQAQHRLEQALTKLKELGINPDDLE